MDGQMRISDVAKNYHITKRTLRYYEEIGLLPEIRKDDSNYRCYDENSLVRLEQILLLREIGFHIQDIKELLSSKDEAVIDFLLSKRLGELKDSLTNIAALKRLLESIITIKNKEGIEKVGLYQILKEQIYIHKNQEKVFQMSQFIGDLIVVDFGMGLVDHADTIIQGIRAMREQIKTETKCEIPLIRIKDELKLKENEYRIRVKGVTVKQELLDNVVQGEWAASLLNALKEALLCNIQSIAVENL